MIIDTDGGIDDASAIWWALESPEVDVVGITTVHGNIDAVTAAANVCRILEAAGRPEIPVAVGADLPFAEAPEMRPADFIHGTDGIGDTGRPAAGHGPVDDTADELLTRLVAEASEPLTLVTLGPLTNIAHRVTADPAWAGALDRLVIMGGSVNMPGNAKPGAEANIAHDPAAAAAVVHAAWSRPPLMVGLDVTHVGTFTDARVRPRRPPPHPCGPLPGRAAGVLPPLRRHVLRAGGVPAARPAGGDGRGDPGAGARTGAPGGRAGHSRAGVGRGRGRPSGAVLRAGRRRLAPSPSPTASRLWELGLEVDVERFRVEVRRLFGG